MTININCLTLENVDLTSIRQETSVEETYLYSSLNFINECKEDYCTVQKELYKRLVTCESTQAINESFGSFFGKIKQIIDKFLKFMKSLLSRFILNVNKFFKSEKYLKKHSKDLYLFNSDDEFEFNGFDFTFDPEVPAINAMAEYSSDFVKINATDVTGDLVDNVVNNLKDKRAKLLAELNDDYYDKLRGRILGKDGERIASGDFNAELFATFRGGYNEPNTITADKELVINALGFLNNFQKQMKDVQDLMKKIEKEYEQIKKDIENMTYRNKDNNLGKTDYLVDTNYNKTHATAIADERIFTQLNLYLKDKTMQIDKMSSLHSIAFASKLDALKSCLVQSKGVLYTALKKVEKNHYKEKGGK